MLGQGGKLDLDPVSPAGRLWGVVKRKALGEGEGCGSGKGFIQRLQRVLVPVILHHMNGVGVRVLRGPFLQKARLLLFGPASGDARQKLAGFGFDGP